MTTNPRSPATDEREARLAQVNAELSLILDIMARQAQPTAELATHKQRRAALLRLNTERRQLRDVLRADYVKRSYPMTDTECQIAARLADTYAAIRTLRQQQAKLRHSDEYRRIHNREKWLDEQLSARIAEATMLEQDLRTAQYQASPGEHHEGGA